MGFVLVFSLGLVLVFSLGFVLVFSLKCCDIKVQISFILCKIRGFHGGDYEE
jgi:hypothetical protein